MGKRDGSAAKGGAGEGAKVGTIPWIELVEVVAEFEHRVDGAAHMVFGVYKYRNHLTPGLAEVSASGCGLHLLPG